jgi:hypothetical protein
MPSFGVAVGVPPHRTVELPDPVPSPPEPALTGIVAEESASLFNASCGNRLRLTMSDA